LRYYYDNLTEKLIRETAKIIDELDIDQLLVAHAKEQSKFWAMVTQHFEKIGYKTDKQPNSNRDEVKS
jgi:hypothetical protein